MTRNAITALLARSAVLAVLAISALAQAQPSWGQQRGLTNPGFEEPRVEEGTFVLLDVLVGTMPGWKTTDTHFEIWGTGFKGVLAHEGTQFVELNAYIDGALYQESTGIQQGSVLEFTFAHRGRNGDDTMQLIITDLGADNAPGGGDDTILFTKQYTTGKDAWAVYDSTTEQQIKALGNTVMFAYAAVSTATGELGEGNLLDAANFGVGVVTAPPIADVGTETNSLGMEFKLIPAGKFIMGSPDCEEGRDDDEQQHVVTITSDYYIGVTEVTQSQWQQVMGTTPWKGQENVIEGNDIAANYISWNDAVEFCRKLSQQEGRTYRLPTEAEWEHACRAGTTTAYSFGDDVSQLEQYAWYFDSEPKHSSQVKQKSPNRFGLYDMHGNLIEFCQDWYGAYPQGHVTDPPGPSSGTNRVCRGGGFAFEAPLVRSASRRIILDSAKPFPTFGLRVVLVPGSDSGELDMSETPPENAMKLDITGGAFTFGYRTTDKPGFNEFPNTDSPHPGIMRRNIKDGDYFSFAQNTRETELKAQESSLVHYPAKAEGSGVLCPGQNPGDIAIARFTAMDDGEYNFKISAELIEEDPTGAGVTIYVNGQAVAETQLTGHLVPWSTSFRQKLTKGQTVDIAVDSGVDKNWEKDHVLVNAKAWTTGPAKQVPFVVSEPTGNTAQFNAIAEFSLQLSAKPSSKVTVPVASSDEMQGVPLQTELVFTPEDWQQSKRVVVRGTNNNVLDGKQDYRIVLGPAVSTDPKYHGLKPDDVALKGIELLLSPPEVLNGFLANEAISLKPEIRYTASNLLSFALTESPEGMTIDLSSGQISWTPRKADEGESHPVHVTVNDQTRFASVEFAVIVAKPTELAVEVKNNTLRVVDESTSLKGMSISQLAGDNMLAQLNLGKVEANAVPEMPEYVTTISDVFAVGGSFKGEVELRFPLPRLPAGVSPRDVSLYSLVSADFHGDNDHGKFWSPVGLDINHEGTAESPVTAVKLAGLAGFSVWGYTTPDAKNAAADNSSNAQGKDATGTPSSAPVTASITIKKKEEEKDGNICKDYICTASQGTVTSTITVLNWGDTKETTRWNGVTLEGLVSDLLTSQQWFTSNKLGFDREFAVSIHQMPVPGWLGYVAGSETEQRRVLHLTEDNSQSKNLMRATIVHEYFHHAQGHTKTKMDAQELLINEKTEQKNWLTEGTAQWFEDELFDDLNSYVETEMPGATIAEVGINDGTGDGRQRSYQRFSFFKLLTTKYPGFESDIQSFLNVNLADDPSGIKNLVSKLNKAKCNFGDHFGPGRAKKLETALAFYNYATQFKGQISLLDANEPDTFPFNKPVFLFDQFPNSLDDSHTAKLVGVTDLPAAAAISFMIPPIDGTLSPGKVAELVVDSAEEVLVSITSSSSDFVGTNKIGADQHAWFSTKESVSYVYRAGGTVPELFVTLVNTSIETSAKMKVSFRIRDERLPEPVITTPAAAATVSNRVVTVTGEIPAAARTTTTSVRMTVNGISTEVPMSPDGKYSMEAVVALGQNSLKIEGFNGTTPTTAVKLNTVNGVESASNERNALLASRAVFVLRWDTDKTDMDLYCTDKNDKTIWYNENAVGPGNLDYDTRDGFGPEVVTYRARGADIGDLYTNGGRFDLDVHYFEGTPPTSFTLDIILNETEGDNRRVLQYKSKNSLSAGNKDDSGPKKSGSTRFNNIVKIICSQEGVCSLGSFDDNILIGP